MKIMSKEVFETIQVGQEVSLKNNVWLSVTGRDKGGALLCGDQKISRVSLKGDAAVRNNPTAIKKVLTGQAKIFSKPKEKHPNTIKLEALVSKYPEKKDAIFDMALKEKLTVEEIYSTIVMSEAGIKVRASSMAKPKLAV